MKVCVIGLGYVGLPLALEISKFFETIGYDCNKERILELQNSIDKNNEFNLNQLRKLENLTYVDNLEKENLFHSNQNIFIVCVPTPVFDNKVPNLDLINKAIGDISQIFKKDDIVIFESTVYPGCVEQYCIPLLSKYTSINVAELNYGFSPERINPGDLKHTIQNVTKVISASNNKTLQVMKELYGKVTQGNIFVAKDIKTAEIAKLTENIQRDVNIALMNEISLICEGLDIDIKDVLEACRTKWNFLDFRPGLVGGHCVSVDPYYLIYQAQKNNLKHGLILKAREVNDSMAINLVNKLNNMISTIEKNKIGKVEVLFLGLAFKENVKDTRNSLIIKVINDLSKRAINANLTASDPIIKLEDVLLEKNVIFLEDKNLKLFEKSYDLIVLNNKHDQYLKLDFTDYANLVSKSGNILDLTLSQLNFKNGESN
jgi:UDP-N-acetyl-D-galactosamine dehydrogenase